MAEDEPIKILVVEDDPDGLRSVVEAIRDAGFAVVSATTGRAGVELAARERPDVVLSDLFLPDIDGLAVMSAIHQAQPLVPVLIMTAYGTVDTAVKALKQGAYDYLVKPLDLDDVQAKLTRAVEAGSLRRQVTSLRAQVAQRYSLKTMVAGAPVMQEVLRQIAAVAGTNATVLVLGESGTGKELVARALHSEGRRSQAPFVAVNCGAFTESLLESELFGHEKGAFTGAVARHEGAFERAQGGTLFLDEIALAPMPVQSRLLRALEEREVLRVGGRDPVKVDVRIVAATNRDLDEMVDSNEFRRDLLYRLQVVSLHLPPLRERREDIQALAERFMAKACAEHGRHLGALDQACLAKLAAHAWPGNVRELRNVMEAAVIMAEGTRLTPGDLRLKRDDMPPGGAVKVSAATTLADLEKEAILQALRRHEGNRQMSADELGISSRTIQRKIREYNLPF